MSSTKVISSIVLKFIDPNLNQVSKGRLKVDAGQDLLPDDLRTRHTFRVS